MNSLQFKKTSASTAEDFQAVFVETDYKVDAEQVYKDINAVQRRLIGDVFKKWTIKFSHLTDAKMDYLLELKKETAPQLILNSVTYTVIIESVKPRPVGGSIVVINTVKE